ncbi:Protein amnionless [Zootermopsis nevadensis]|uniref:Protein amnionless n=1 Tax=Zootermopsis nevadensis TaxID=136037 RepID=A0A067RK47_ZOONE|nr:Protein amnionless [Zootermopsis nevadensis]
MEIPGELTTSNAYGLIGNALLLQDMAPNEWEDALLTEPGERQFVTGEGDFTRTSSVVITGQERCSDKTGCSCEGHSELRAAVCRYTRNNNGDCYDSSRKTTCVAPVQPLGHCCAFCGAYLLLEYSASKVELGRLHSLLESYLRQDRYSSIAAHVGKPAMVEDAPRNRLQIVLADAGVYRGDCGDLADTLAAELRNNDHFGVSGVTVYASGEPLRASTWASVFGTLLGTLAAALIVLGLIFFVFTNYRPNGWVLQAHPILFARFENALSESEEAVESRVEMMPAERSTGHQASAAFDNPMYGKTKAEEGEKAVPPRGEPGKQEAHDNPVYSELLLKDEPQEGASDVQVT